MIYGVVITDPALDDIAGIISYIWDLTGNQRTAEGYMYGILETAKSLEEMPYRFEMAKEPELTELGIRKAYYEDYTIGYGVDDDASEVIVYRVIYSKSDISKRFFEKGL